MLNLNGFGALIKLHMLHQQQQQQQSLVPKFWN